LKSGDVEVIWSHYRVGNSAASNWEAHDSQRAFHSHRLPVYAHRRTAYWEYAFDVRMSEIHDGSSAKAHSVLRRLQCEDVSSWFFCWF
jgi:hypothetical protein